MMEAFRKHVRVGTLPGFNRRNVPVRMNCYVTISWDGKRLSICGVQGPLSNGDALGSCGQCTDMLVDPEFKAEPDIDAVTLHRFWEEWHLNDCTAGSPAQQAWLKDHPPEEPFYPVSHFEKACAILTEAGLQPDPEFLHNGKPYRYGSAWLHRDVPEYVVSFLKALPDTLSLPTCWMR